MTGRAAFVVGIVGAVALVAVAMFRMGRTQPSRALENYAGLGAGAPAATTPASAAAPATGTVPASVTTPATLPATATGPATAPPTSPGTTVSATPTAPTLRPGDSGGATDRDAEPMVPWVERAPETDAGKGDYIVGPGSESLYTVALRMLGDATRVNEVREANPGILNPDAIPAGTRLKIPGKNAPKAKAPKRLGSGVY